MHEAFLQAIQEKPADDSARLIYADWLEEQSDPAAVAQAAYLRLECERATLADGDPRRLVVDYQIRELARTLEVAWLAVVSKREVENCPLEFAFQCPKHWHQLTPTPRTEVRHCESCQKEVHYCHSVAEARIHAWMGHCVAVSAHAERHPNDLTPPEPDLGGMTMGVLAYDPPPPPRQPRPSWWRRLFGGQ